MIREIDGHLSLVPYYPAYDITLPWYQDRDICRQCDNRDTPYDLELLRNMYEYLCERGDCFYIAYDGVPVGDITLKNDGEICIVVSHAWQNRHLGRRAVGEIIKLAREKGMTELTATIYTFNHQSRKMFASVGFEEKEPENFVLKV